MSFADAGGGPMRASFVLVSVVFVAALGAATKASAAPPPPSWTCGASFYDTDDGCDCECGAYDPDCADANATLYRCPDDAVGCNIDGECRIVPTDWTCNPAYYDDNAGCDCACGALDPDCARDDQTLYGCPTGADGCNVDGDCRVIPGTWTCAKGFYDTRDGCDCGCGAGDPDCDVADQNLIGCPSGATGCTDNGVCEVIPSTWTCLSSLYDTSDGCDCACGAYDPDCAEPGAQLYGCPSGASGCGLDGTCEVVPSSWTCPDGWYDGSDGCDCSCGAHDPDCDDAGSSLFGCPQGAVSCNNGTCVTPVGPPPSWFCSDSHYDSNDGCDCGCGATDPDCASTPTPVFGCPQGTPGCSAAGVCLPPPSGPPPSWTCGSVFYDRGDGCDCGCGAPDPDCALPNQDLYGCPQSATGCTGNGTCIVPAPMIPTTWTCATTAFNSGDGCHCDCGAPDPDCVNGAPVVGCPGNATGCSVDGECVLPNCAPTCAGAQCGGDGCGGSCGSCDDEKVCVDGLCLSGVPPATWICPANNYDAADGCDCACGAYDPDCDDGDATVYGCTQGSDGCDATGRCVADDDVTGWTCAVSHFNAGDGCDCDCGIRDLDCDDDDAPLFGCPQGAAGCGADGKCVGTTVPPPTSWTCPASRYNAADGCDCGCGVRDPDCDIVGAPLYGCSQDAIGCAINGTCVVDGCESACTGRECGADGCGGTCGTCGGGEVCNTGGQCVNSGPPATWTCPASTYGNGAACQCECGVSDPDCANATLPITGCDDGVLGCDAAGKCVYPDVCAPTCGEKVCGPDGCGGSCGGCEPTDFCSAEGNCLPRVIGGDGDDDDDEDEDPGPTRVRSGCSASEVTSDGVHPALVAVVVGALTRMRRRRRANSIAR